MHCKRIFYKNVSCSITRIDIKEMTQCMNILWIILAYQVNNKHTVNDGTREPNSSMILTPRNCVFIISLYGSVADLDYQDNSRDDCITVAPQFIWSSCSLKFSSWITQYNLLRVNRILKVRICKKKIFRKGWDYLGYAIFGLFNQSANLYSFSLDTSGKRIQRQSRSFWKLNISLFGSQKIRVEITNRIQRNNSQSLNSVTKSGIV